jgi:YbbR domain-containing protein
VVLREDRLIAASCVLPLTQQPLSTRRRLGTRHRAAVGLSEHSDALIIVVSEETGTISLARDGQLRRPVDSTTLREQLFEFYVPPQPTHPVVSVRQLLRRAGRQVWTNLAQVGLWWRRPRLIFHGVLPQLGLLLLSLLLALITWTFVIERTNPARQELFEDVALRVENIPPGVTLSAEPPANVSVTAQTTNSLLPSLRSSSFQASINLAGLAPGIHSVPVQVSTTIPRVWVLSVEPPTIDVEVTPIVTKTMAVNIVVPDRDELSPAYRVVGVPFAEPAEVQVIGAASVVEQVTQVQAEIFLGNATATLKRTRPLQALDALNRVINGVSLEPKQVEVNVLIQRQLNARNVAVRPVTSGVPPDGYRLSGLTVTPPEVTLQGSVEQLGQVDNVVDTLPVDISQATGDLNLQVPLALPSNVQALDSRGEPIRTVTVQAQVVPRNSYLLVSRPVELLGISPSITATVNPSQVDLIISGPAPIVSQIEKEPGLIKVLVDLVGVDPPQRLTRLLTIAAPDEIQVQVIPESVQVTLLP